MMCVREVRRAEGKTRTLWSSAGETSPFNVASKSGLKKNSESSRLGHSELLIEEQTSLLHGNELPILPGNARTTRMQLLCAFVYFIEV